MKEKRSEVKERYLEGVKEDKGWKVSLLKKGGIFRRKKRKNSRKK